jgi:Ca2+-binding RTX toxin-like protein
MNTDVKNLLKYANLQTAAEARLDLFNYSSPSGLEDALKYGNNRSSKFTDVLAAQFTSEWSVVDHKPNTSTGFSGTLFRNNATGELVLSFRSTEFADDAARDNQATNAMEIRPFGYAFGQIADMKAWTDNLLDTNKINANQPLTVTGYSLGGHLAGAFSEIYPNLATATYTFNGAGIGKPVTGGLNALIQEFNNRRLAGNNLDLFNTPWVRSLYQDLYGQLRTSNSALSLVKINEAIETAKSASEQGTLGLTSAAEYRVLFNALVRIKDIAEEAIRVDCLPNSTGNANGVALQSIEALNLDYQLAVLKAGEKTESYGDLNAIDKAFGTLSRTEENRTNFYDVYGDTSPSMVSNSQRHLGTGTKVWIEDQPEARGSVASAVWNNSSVATGVKLLVPEFSTNDFGDTHSLVLIVDSLAVQNTLVSLDSKQTKDSLVAILKAASNSKVLTDTPTQGKADGDTLENVVNDLARIFGQSATLVGKNEGGTWANLTDRNKLHDQLKTVENFIKTKELAGKFTLTASVSSALTDIRKDFSSLLGLISGARFGIKAKEGSLDAVNSALGSIQGYNAEFNAFSQDKALIDQKGDLSKLNYTDNYLNDRSAYLNSLVQANLKNQSPLEDGSLTVIAPGARNTDFIDLVNNKQVRVRAGVGAGNAQRVIFGNADADTINGASEADRLYGGSGADTLDGKGGNDYLEGGVGADTLIGGEGNDQLLGGAGNDTYQFTSAWGKDTITDSDGQGSIQLAGITLGTFQGAGNQGAYAFELGAGTGIYAGLAIKKDTSSSTGYRATIVKGTDKSHTITIQNFDLDKAQGTEGYLCLGLCLGQSFEW